MSKKMSKKRKEIRNRSKQAKKQIKKEQEKIKVEEVVEEENSNIPPSKLVFSEFICLACYSPKMVFEPYAFETSVYQEKEEYCPCCKEVTPQVCVKDISLLESILSTTKEKSDEETKAYQAIKKLRLRRK